MNRRIFPLSSALVVTLVTLALSTPAFAQSAEPRPDPSIARQTADSTPSPVVVMSQGAGRRPFQQRLIVGPTSTGFASASLAIPAGKRLVIENVSAIARSPEGLKMEINFFTYVDNGDGVATITFHRIALTDQGTFDGTAIASANHKVQVFADGQIGGIQQALVMQARLNGTTTQFAQAQVTFSGYLEDVPAAQ